MEETIKKGYTDLMIEMTETIWIYENKEGSISNNVADTYKLTNEEMELSDKEDKEYLESLSEEEREWTKNSASDIDWEELEKQKEERNKKYDGGRVLATKFVKFDNGFYEEIQKYTAVLKDGKIGIFYPDLFCDYLRNEEELKIFFKNIGKISDPIEGDTRKIEYRRNAESVYICFDLEEIINGHHMIMR